MISEMLAFVLPKFVPDEPSTTTGLSFSEAILRGCQTTTSYPNSYLNNESACVLGAAIRGAGWIGLHWHPQLTTHRAFYERHFGRYGVMHDAYYHAYRSNFERDLLQGMPREVIAQRFQAIGR